MAKINYQQVIENLEELSWTMGARQCPTPRETMLNDVLYYLKQDWLAQSLDVLETDEFTPTGEIDVEPESGAWVTGRIWIDNSSIGHYRSRKPAHVTPEVYQTLDGEYRKIYG